MAIIVNCWAFSFCGHTSEIWIWVLALLLTSSVILGKSLKISRPYFFTLKNWKINTESPYFKGFLDSRADEKKQCKTLYMCVCIYMHVWVYMHIYAYFCMYSYIYMHVYTYIHTYTHRLWLWKYFNIQHYVIYGSREVGIYCLMQQNSGSAVIIEGRKCSLLFAIEKH